MEDVVYTLNNIVDDITSMYASAPKEPSPLVERRVHQHSEINNVAAAVPQQPRRHPSRSESPISDIDMELEDPLIFYDSSSSASSPTSSSSTTPSVSPTLLNFTVEKGGANANAFPSYFSTADEGENDTQVDDINAQLRPFMCTSDSLKPIQSGWQDIDSTLSPRAFIAPQVLVSGSPTEEPKVGLHLPTLVRSLSNTSPDPNSPTFLVPSLASESGNWDVIYSTPLHPNSQFINRSLPLTSTVVPLGDICPPHLTVASASVPPVPPVIHGTPPHLPALHSPTLLSAPKLDQNEQWSSNPCQRLERADIWATYLAKQRQWARMTIAHAASLAEPQILPPYRPIEQPSRDRLSPPVSVSPPRRRNIGALGRRVHLVPRILPQVDWNPERASILDGGGSRYSRQEIKSEVPESFQASPAPRPRLSLSLKIRTTRAGKDEDAKRRDAEKVESQGTGTSPMAGHPVRKPEEQMDKEPYALRPCVKNGKRILHNSESGKHSDSGKPIDTNSDTLRCYVKNGVRVSPSAVDESQSLGASVEANERATEPPNMDTQVATTPSRSFSAPNLTQPPANNHPPYGTKEMSPESPTSRVDILTLGAGWLSHFLIPLLRKHNLTHAATSQTSLASDTIAWSLGDSVDVLPRAGTVVIMFPILEWEKLRNLVDAYEESRGECMWILLGSSRAWQTAGSDSSNPVIKRSTPLPPDAPPRSVVENHFLNAYPQRVAVLNLVGLHGYPPVPGDAPHSAPRLVPNFIKAVAQTKDGLKQKSSIHFIHGSDAALAILLVHQKGRGMVGRWIVSDCLTRDWWAITLELGNEQEKRWVMEIMNEEKVGVLPRHQGLNRIVDGSEFWIEAGVAPGHVGLSVATFLGTSSGGGPTQGRNCSSLALSVNDEIWLVDCAEGTQRQIHKSNHLDIYNVTKIFITHMHVDHCVGVVPLLSTVMSVFGTPAQQCNNDPNKLHIEIYGTPGLRQLIRTTLNLTHMNLSGKYVVHELHLSEGIPDPDEATRIPILPPHPNEIVGLDIRSNSQQFWCNIGRHAGMRVDAGLIEHRVTCVGYVFTEWPTPPTLPRRVVSLGDTSSASHIVPLCISEGIYPSLVIHEATNAWIPPRVDHQRLYGGARKTPQSVREKAISRGHSTPDMAGAFARSVQAERLALIHFSAMFKNPTPKDPVMREIARQATAAWGRRGAHAVAAHDLYWIDIPLRNNEIPSSQQTTPSNSATESTQGTMVWDPNLWEDPVEPDQSMPTALKRKWDQGQHARGRGPFHGHWRRGRGRGRGADGADASQERPAGA
ncbi:hypothetical protein CTheo_1097 [Ceratobasidium theobromae]|uniref:Uncharacterized protein n=1 Tax=Ceratobasidium theobromae TaxID=1582974 RepID=A0A5N5QUJ5_9AGAM|nr:hypothetical protein CTheo_1097 [Ceratobasidium theobromae]